MSVHIRYMHSEQQLQISLRTASAISSAKTRVNEYIDPKILLMFQISEPDLTLGGLAW